MNIRILTLFPDFLRQYFETSIMGRAVAAGKIAVTVTDIRDFSTDRHRTVDDAPYGGGAGMVLMPEPLGQAIESVRTPESHCVYPTPSGRIFRQSDARRLSEYEDLILICGRYEGIDQRIIDEYVDEELSIGDYVLSSGELAAMVIVDAVFRLKDGIIRPESLVEESFQDGLLEYPHYTRPEVYHGNPVPDVLISGHHRKITEWRNKKRIEKTMRNRPDLLPTDGSVQDERSENGRH